ncbi:hypothetical protein M378DRAFT_16817 [Amanita muscaria Koide BX008]|uniref:Uncharacterized protein n=1 Tax=Amanita muscaria (strain Koide BX008) TaxID=946122 RepID=A0A0C2S241_AMAMK|nr:hypothetical protein M378DRAFT_16817 [Amanita muscaria Koide BX008]
MHPKLSKEARASLLARHRASRELYSDAMKTAVAQVNKITQTLATSQHKSIRHVEKDLRFASQLTRKRHQKTNAWNAWIWSISQEKGNIDGIHGKEVLLTLVSERKAKYEKLTNEEREKMVCLFEESKAMQTTARQIKTVSRINDISATMLAIENEGLKFLSMRGTTDFSINGYSFATEGVSDFLEQVIRIDTQEFLSKISV